MLIAARVVAILAAAVPFVSNCAVNKCWLEARSFYSAPFDTWPDKLAVLPLDQRFDLYVCGISNVRPAPLGLANAVAKGDGPVLSAMLDHLERSTDAATLIGAANVAVEFSRIHPERACQNDKLFRALRGASNKIGAEQRPLLEEISSAACRDFKFREHNSRDTTIPGTR